MKVEIEIADSSFLHGINFIRHQISEDQSSPHTLPALGVSDVERSDKQITFIAKNDMGIVGYLSLHNKTSLQRPVDAEFEMFVLPEAQGKGIGTSLVIHVVEFAASSTSLSRLTLGVMNKNQGARSLYERLGFYSISKDSIGEYMARDIER